MTALAQRITETPMAPYVGLIRGMSLEEKRVVVAFIVDSMEEQESKEIAEIIREKYKNLRISPRVKALVDGLSLSKEGVDEERTKYMLGI